MAASLGIEEMSKENYRRQINKVLEKLSKDHHISESFISEGNQELRRLNLLDIQYGELEDLRFSQRQANTYFVQDLYDPNELKAKLKYLEQKHGRDKFNNTVKSMGQGQKTALVHEAKA